MEGGRLEKPVQSELDLLAVPEPGSVLFGAEGPLLEFELVPSLELEPPLGVEVPPDVEPELLESLESVT